MSVGLDSTTLYAARGRLTLQLELADRLDLYGISTFVSTRALMRICPGLASSQSREATLDTVPMAA